MKYFAYSGFMNKKVYRNKFPGLAILGRARIDGATLQFSSSSHNTKIGHCDINTNAERPGSVVWGLVFEIPDSYREALQYEGYRQAEVDAVDEQDVVHRCMTIKLEKPGLSKRVPRQKLAEICKGISDAGICDDYRKQIEEIYRSSND